MKKRLLCFIIFLITYSANSQNLFISNVDASGFPNVKANLFAFDASWNQQSPDKGELSIKENGLTRTVLNVTCSTPIKPLVLSSVLVMDISNSMSGNHLDIAKAAAQAWVNAMPTDNSECALTTFNHFNYFNQDFTTDKTKLLKAINTLSSAYGTDYNFALIDSMCGGLRATKTSKYQKIIVLMTDGLSSSVTEVSKIVAEAKLQKCKIFVVTLDMKCPKELKDISSQTGGQWYENITTESKAAEIYRTILKIAQGAEPCSITWKSEANCDSSDINLELMWNGIKATSMYPTPPTAVHKLEVTPATISFGPVALGKSIDTTISIKATGTDFKITAINLKYGSNVFQIKNVTFPITVSKNATLKIPIKYTPADSNLCYGGFEIITDYCSSHFSCIGGFSEKPMNPQTLKLTNPNGGEGFYINSDTLITWTGVVPSDTVKLEYSVDNGLTWNLITDKATGLKYLWRDIPNPKAINCLVRVSLLVSYINDKYIKIDNKVWMKGNLNVSTYRNGDPIPVVTDPSEWRALKTDACCYYNNDPLMAKYGKLYNWASVNDSRGLAPEGWHVASKAEWKELEIFLSGASIAGGKLKSTGTIEGGNGLWLSPNTGATNELGFFALPGGYRSYDGNYEYEGNRTAWWSSTEIHSSDAWDRYVFYNSTELFSGTNNKGYGMYIRCIKDDNAIISSKFEQCDQSDATFSIVEPKAIAFDINMNKCLVGCSKDSTIVEFIKNMGSFKFRVDSIYFRGADANAFSLVSALPKYEILPNSWHSEEFRFAPKRSGIYNAEMVIITQSDTLIRNIRGEGIEPQIKIESEIVDFGKVNLSYQRDSLQVLTIKNISKKPITITNTKINGPNLTDFKTIATVSNFTLQPEETKKIDLRFKPSGIGRTSGILTFYYDGVGSPAEVQLYGEGVMGDVQDLVSPANDTINVPIDCILIWKPNMAYNSYNLQVAKDENFANIAIDTTTKLTNYKISNLDFLQTYYWRVKAINGSEQSNWSPVWKFTTLMDTVKLTAPENNSFNLHQVIKFEWEEGIYQKYYRLQISEDKDFKTIADNIFAHQSHMNVVDLKFFTKYFWRMRNESGDTLGYWSNIWQFKTGMSKLSLIYPENTQTGLAQEINFKWSDVIGAEYYQLQISKNYYFTNLVYSMDSITPTEKMVTNFELQTQYYWRVRIWNEESIDSAYWSEVWTFKTGTSGVSDESEFIDIIPNPAGDFITITLKPSEGFEPSEGSEIQIYNMLGEKVMTVGARHTVPLRINISALPKGMYFVRFGGETAKFVKL